MAGGPAGPGVAGDCAGRQGGSGGQALGRRGQGAERGPSWQSPYATGQRVPGVERTSRAP